jgi:hypothetical protein
MTRMTETQYDSYPTFVTIDGLEVNQPKAHGEPGTMKGCPFRIISYYISGHIMITSSMLRVILALLLCVLTEGLLSPRIFTNHPRRALLLQAKTGKGFGKPQEQLEEKPKAATPSAANFQSTAPGQDSFLKSVEVGGSDAIPVLDDVPPEDRIKYILREKYGLKPLEEQQADAKQLEALNERRRKKEEWQKKAETEPEFDLMTTLPAPLLIGIDRFLKGGVVVCGFLFIVAGLFITAEAWSKTSGQPLPADLDNFIVTIVEPNFTPGLLVLLSFSVGLGLFAAAQMGSAGASYKED